MKKHLLSAISLVLLTSAVLSPAMAAGPRVSDSNRDFLSRRTPDRPAFSPQNDDTADS